MTFNRIKDDPCYKCKHASLKDPEKCDIFERLYLCHNKERVDCALDLLKKTVYGLNSNSGSFESLLNSTLYIQTISGVLVDLLNKSKHKDGFTTEPYDGIVCPYKKLAKKCIK